MISKIDRGFSVRQEGSHWAITFSAMASPCEILVRCKDKSEAEHLASLSFSETRRIENKFSRYRDDNIVYAINNSDGKAIEADEELARMLDSAEQCYRISGGLFDITSGILRKAWKFDGGVFTPDKELITFLLELVGWDKVSWDGRNISLRPGMEIDFGGIGKEYAVDIVAEMLFRAAGVPLMVNFGGDIRAISNDKNPEPWVVGIEDPTLEDSAVGEINLTNGGIATSGDSRRYCLVDGVRLGHILNPRTGWPVAEAPRSITVLGNNSTEAGLLATLAILQGADAERFLAEQKISYHCIH